MIPPHLLSSFPFTILYCNLHSIAYIVAILAMIQCNPQKIFKSPSDFFVHAYLPSLYKGLTKYAQGNPNLPASSRPVSFTKNR